jgi:hypothetical protein
MKSSLICCSLGFVATIAIALPAGDAAAQKKPVVLKRSFLQTFNPPTGRGAPKGTAGGGSRPAQLTCAQPNSQASFLLLAPNRFLGLTASDRPTFWISIPKTTAKSLEFSLFDDKQVGVYQVSLPISSTEKLASISLPNSVPTLAAGKSYYWTAALVCNSQRRTDDWVLGGWVQRQPLSPAQRQQLQGFTLQQQYTFYADNGYWYEAVNTLLQLRRSQPKNAALEKTWTDLLQVGGLAVTPPSGQVNP